VSFDPNADNKAFKDKFNFPYDLLTDGDRVASTAYGVVTSDTGNASRVSVLVAPDGTVAKAYETVTPAEHPDQVLADLATL
ncbi:MAG TPA: redoxin domain-containing protein, partial [Rhodospirillales bacterium]|jgi:peroxiredoxin Q/BCP|nr:redoxin domain-containing protein [Rhodospirillales bacterium]